MTVHEVIRDYPVSEAKKLAHIRAQPTVEDVIPAKPSETSEIGAARPQNVSDKLKI